MATTDSLPEVGDRVDIKNLLPVSNPENRLYGTAMEICDYTGIKLSEIPGIPLEHRVRSSMLALGNQGIRMIDGKPVSFIYISTSVKEDDSFGKSVLVEETFHHIQTVMNSALLKERAEVETDRSFQSDYSQSSALYENLKQSSGKAMIEFASKTGIDSSLHPQTEAEKELVLKRRIERLSPEQAARLYTALDQMGVASDGENEHRRFVDNAKEYRKIEKRIDELREEEKNLESSDDSIKLRDIRERIRSLREGFDGLGTLSSLISYQLEQRIARVPDGPERSSILEKALAKSFVDLDTLGAQSMLYEERIKNLTPDQIRKALEDYLASRPDLDSLIFLNRDLTIEDNEEHLKVLRILESGDPESMEYENLRQSFQKRIENQLQVAGVDDLAKFYTESLIYLMRGVEKSLAANALVEENLIFLFDDLPMDDETRKRFVGNSEFMRQLRDFVLKSVKSGELSPFGSEGLDVGLFSSSRKEAGTVLKKSLKRPTDDINATAFLADMKSATEYTRSNISGDQFDFIEAGSERNIEVKLKETFPDRSIADLPSGTEFRDAQLAAYQESVEIVRKSRKESEHKHSTDILIEPIAKVISQKLSGGTRNDIVFPETMMGGYTIILRTQELKEWVDKLWTYVDKVHEYKNSGGDASLREFIHATSLDQQRAVVEKFIKVIK